MSALIVISINAQDFKCTFSVTSNTNDGNTDRTRFQEMQKTIQEFINSVKWCNYNIGPEERIECTMQLVITEIISSDEYNGYMNIGLRRPVYNSSYTTTLLSLVDDKVRFTYNEGEPLIFNEGTFDSNLTSLIAYYMYIFLGIDFDTFAPKGGTEYFDKAQSIVNAAQSAVESGWKSYESKQNRYWLVENMLNNSYSGIRDFLYLYHLKGLDAMYDNTTLATSYVTQAVEKLRAANRQKPGLYAVTLVLEAKRDEMVKLYSGAPDNDKTKFLQVMTEIDPSNISTYNKIKQ